MFNHKEVLLQNVYRVMQEAEDYEEIRCEGLRSPTKRIFKGFHRRRGKVKDTEMKQNVRLLIN